MKKGITIGIISLFIVSAVSPIVVGFDTGESQHVKQSDIQTKDRNILYVGGTGLGNYTKIQDAIDNASDGDTVFVYDDSSPYVENVIVNKSINLIGEDKDTTAIDGDMSGEGVYVTADWVNISGFTIQNCGFYEEAIVIRSNYSNIIDNNISNYDGYGIDVRYSSYNNISGNFFSQNWRALAMWDSGYNVISDNFVVNNTHSVILYKSNSFNIISGNILIGKGTSELIGIDNDCNNNSIVYNSVSNGDEGIIIRYSSSNNNFTGNRINNCKLQGLELRECSTSIVHDNVIMNCGREGIVISSSDSNIISSNYISGNSRSGFYMGGSDSNMIFNNTFVYNGEHGFYSSGSLRNKIFNNTINSNENHGIYLYSWSDYNKIFNNAINLNNGNGIILKRSCKNNSIFDNNVASNNASAIRVEEESYYASIYNYIYHNNFVNNSYGGYDDNDSNIWDYLYPSGGNYWSDYNGTDNYRGINQDIPGYDGIGDIPYNLSGGDNKDRYPLMYPWGEQRPVANYSYKMEYGGCVFDGSSSYDRDGYILLYEWDFGDGTTSQEVVVAHGFNETGTYNVILTVTDDDGYQGSYIRSIKAEKNNPPSAPLIDGPVEEKARKSHLYDFTSEDPEMADVSYYIEWGDGTIEDWSEFQPTGEPYDSNHGWAKGTYTIRCKAKDIYGAESGWGTLKVTMPKYVWFLNLLNRLPLLQRLLEWLFGTLIKII